jgi:hypothetical protein
VIQPFKRSRQEQMDSLARWLYGDAKGSMSEEEAMQEVQQRVESTPRESFADFEARMGAP